MVRATRRHRASRTRKAHRAHRGGGVVTSQQFFDPDVYPPHTNMPAVSTAPTNTAIRPVLHSTFKVGGMRRGRGRQCGLRGGFYPTVMGPFLKNARDAIVPLALYSAYHFMPKKGRNIFSLRRSKSRSRK